MSKICNLCGNKILGKKVKREVKMPVEDFIEI